jgi:hypothetical protein
MTREQAWVSFSRWYGASCGAALGFWFELLVVKRPYTISAWIVFVVTFACAVVARARALYVGMAHRLDEPESF